MATRASTTALRRAWINEHRDALRVGDAVGCGACGFWMPLPESHCPNCGCPDPASGSSGRPDAQHLMRLRRTTGLGTAAAVGAASLGVGGFFAAVVGAPVVLSVLCATMFAATVGPQAVRGVRNAVARTRQARHELHWEQMRPHGYRARAAVLDARRAELSAAIGRMRRALHPPKPARGEAPEAPPGPERAAELRQAIAAAEREWIEVGAMQAELAQRLLRSRAIPYLVALRDRDLDALRRALPDAAPADLRSLATEARAQAGKAAPDAAARWRQIAERFDRIAVALRDLELAHAASTVPVAPQIGAAVGRDAVHDAAVDWLEDEALASAAFDEALAEIEADAIVRGR